MASDRDDNSKKTETNSTVSGVPLLSIYQPPPPPPPNVATLGLQQHQFPPPVPQSYLPRGLFPPFSKDNPPPPSIYYSRYPSPPPVNYGPVMGVYGAPPGMVPVQAMGLTHGENYSAEFAQESVREAFVQKVLFLVFLQLLAMAGLSLLCLEVEYVKDEVVGSHPWVLGIAIFLCLFVLGVRRIHRERCRKPPMDVFLFATWSTGLVVLLTWTITLLTFHFLLVTVILLWTLILSFLISSYLFARPLLSFRSSIISGFAILAVSILLLVVYEEIIQNVLFANFTSMIVLMLLFFRLHYLMGDQNRKLKQNEFFHAGTCILF